MTTETITKKDVGEMPTTAITAYEPIRAAVAELRQKYEATVWVIDNASQMLSAKKARQEIRQWRSAGELARVEAKREALEHGRRVDAEAKSFQAELLKLEEPVDHAIKEVEAKQEAKKRAEAEAESRRAEQARAEVEAIRSPAIALVGASSSKIAAELARLREEDVTRADEFTDDAVRAKAETIAKLTELHAASVAHEHEQARIVSERAELAKLRAAQEARDKASAESRELAARHQAKLDAEARARIEAEERAARDRIAAEERAAREAREKADSEARAVRAKADAEALAARQAEEQRQSVERDRIAAERAKAEDKAREEQRVLNQRADAREMLSTFVQRHGQLKEFFGVVKAVEKYFNADTKNTRGQKALPIESREPGMEG